MRKPEISLKSISFMIFSCSVTIFMGQAAAIYYFQKIGLVSSVPISVMLLWISFVLALSETMIKKSMFSVSFILPGVYLSLFIVYEIYREMYMYTSVKVEFIGQLVSALIAFWLAYYFSEKYKSILMIAWLMVMLSSVIAIFEVVANIKVPWSVYLQNKQFASVGMETNPVAFSYSLIVPTVIAIFLLNVTSPNTSKLFLSIVGVCGFIGISCAASRSGLLAIFITSVAALIINRRRKSAIIILIMIIIAIISGAFNNLDDLQSDIYEDQRVLHTYLVYIPVIFSNPFGLGQFESAYDAFLNVEHELPFYLDNYEIHKTTMIIPHNIFLTIGLYYGWFSIIITILILVWVFGICRTYSNIGFKYNNLIIAIGIGIFGLVIHSWFHNASLLNGDMRNWIYVGLLGGIADKCVNAKPLGHI